VEVNTGIAANGKVMLASSGSETIEDGELFCTVTLFIDKQAGLFELAARTSLPASEARPGIVMPDSKSTLRFAICSGIQKTPGLG